MTSLIEESKPALVELCQRFSVRRLYLFGSGTTARFDPNSSDLDFLVELADRQPTKSLSMGLWYRPEHAAPFKAQAREWSWQLSP
jgi:predicted nucleotidyltransferase